MGATDSRQGLVVMAADYTPAHPPVNARRRPYNGRPQNASPTGHMTVRTRIAPSPTGDPHVGTAYVALFNLAFARAHGGQFLLRIEDTDLVRSTRESEQMILDSLRWLGLEWDEGPDVGGPHGPYRQSERGGIYTQHTQVLLDKGHAFRCFCTKERLDALRAEQMAAQKTPGYDGHCAHLSADEVSRRVAAGEPSVVRMKVPRPGRLEGEGAICEIDDLLRGRIEIPWEQVDMQVLMKADGMPTYHLANVVDDHLMQITHVLRGEEWISSAPKHKLLYQYFGWEMPVLCHLPLLRNPDKSKLSKRKNPTSINYYRRMGFLPEAMLNYLGRMGWSMPDEREKFTFADMVANFDLMRVSLGGPVFDVEKLRWLNGQWLRELPPAEFVARLQDWAFNEAYFAPLVSHIQGRSEVLSDVAPLASFLVSGLPRLERAQLAVKGMGEEDVVRLLQFLLWRLEGMRQWSKELLLAEVSALAESQGIKLRDLLAPVFVAISGSSSSISVLDAMAVLGPDMSRARLRHAIEVLGGVSKKQAKELEKAYRALGNAGQEGEAEG
jgi:glutamyl-tRNA synthetase